MPYVKSASKYSKAKGRRYSKKTARKSPKAITALAKQNARQLKTMKFNATQRGTFMLQHVSTDATEPYQYTQVLAPFAWQGIFRSDARNEASDEAAIVKTPSFDIQRMRIDCLVQVQSQVVEAPIQCTYIVCKIKKQYADQFVQNTENGSALQEGVHYVNTPTGTTTGPALTYFNTEIMDILYSEEFQISKYPVLSSATSENTPYVGNIKDASKRIKATIPIKTKLKTTNGFGPSGGTRETSITELTIEDIRPQDRIYTYLFNNMPSLADTQSLHWSQNVIFEGRQPTGLYI